MSSAVAYPRAEVVRRGSRPSARPRRAWRLPALSILGFSILALLAGQRFAALVSHPSFPRVAGIVAVAAALAGGLLATGTLQASDRRLGGLRLGISLLALYLSLRVAGIAGSQLEPWHWGSLARQLNRGTSKLDGLWPYRGHAVQARVAIQACVAAAVVPAAALVFWPGEGGATKRRLAALGLLLSLYVAGAANEPRIGWQVQGLIALSALYIWGWSSRTRRAEDGRAAAWLLTGAILSLPLAGTLAGGAPLINLRAWQPFGEPEATTRFDWNQTYGPLPWPTSPAAMAEAASRAPHLWRATELDRFDGTRFEASGHPPAEPRLAAEFANRRWLTATTFTVRALAGRQLLSPGQILAAQAEGSSPVRLGPPAPDGTLTAPGILHGGARYTVTAYAPHPTVTEMRQAPGTVTAPFRPYVQFDLPSPSGRAAPASSATGSGRARIEASPYAGVYTLARRMAEGSPSGYEVAMRIQRFLRSGFTYDTHTPLTRYPIVTFLLNERRGYCQQFSAAMTLMLRMDGIPARVASGFLSGAHRSASAPFTLRGPDAHAWVEVFFAGIGWVPFDPTPAQPLSRLSGANGGSELSPAQLAASTRAKAGQTHGGVTRRSAGRRSTGHGSTGPLLASGLGLAAVLALLAVALGRTRAAGRRADGDGDGAVEELCRALSRLGLAPPPATTLAELERMLSDSHGAHAAGYVSSLRALRYSPPGTARPPSARERRLLRRALSAGRGPLRRIRGFIALPPRPHLG